MRYSFFSAGLVLLLFLSCLSSRFVSFDVLAAETIQGDVMMTTVLHHEEDEQLSRGRLQEKQTSVEMPITIPVKPSCEETGAELFLLLVVVFLVSVDRYLTVSMTGGFLRLLRCGRVPFRNRTAYWRKTSFAYGRMFISISN